ncbi:MAG: DUF1501 domain-containing protein [Cyanobacteria bacterium P01_F01_bin.86]
MKLTRRTCLLGATGALATAGIQSLNSKLSEAPGVSASIKAETIPSSQPQELLVVIFLRGGCDGLNLVAPVDDPNYVAARPSHLRVQNRGRKAGLPLRNAPADLDFRLHAAAPELKELYDDGSLALVHACGLTNGTRSHFEAQTLMELGTATDKGLTTGWLTRAIAPSDASGLIPVVAISPSLPTSLLGSTSAVAMADMEEFMSAGETIPFTILNQLYQGNTPVHVAGTRTLDSLQALNRLSQQEAPFKDLEGVESYSDDYGYELGRGLRTITNLAKWDLGLQVATIDYDDWDTHVDQSWQFSELVAGLSQSLAAFYEDVTRYRDRVTVLVMTEFGRRLRANDSDGTDHGLGSVMFVLGNQVQGGRIYGQWPGLATEQLDRGADLAITTDFRTVLGEYLIRRVQIPELENVFPNLKSYEPLNIFK